MDLQNTPGLRDIIFDQSLNVSRFSISGNLSVQNLGLTLKSADFLALYDVNLKSLSSSISTLRSLWVQDRPPELLDFPNLTSLGNLSCWRCLSLSMPVLAAVNDTIIFRYPGINKLELPNLNTVNGSLEFWNTSISTLSLPALQSVGNINLSKNPNLTSIALERLTTVGWNLDFSGTFGKYAHHLKANPFDMSLIDKLDSVTIPNLQSVAQNFSIATTNESMSCGVFDAYKDRGIIKGSYQCKGTHPNPSRPTPTSTGLPSSTRSKTPTALSVGQKAGIGVAVPLAVLALTSASIFVLRRKRKQSKDVSSAQDDWAKPEKDGKEISWHELADGLPREMESGKEAHELQAEHGHSEAGIASGVRVIEGTHELGT